MTLFKKKQGCICICKRNVGKFEITDKQFTNIDFFNIRKWNNRF